MTMNSDEARKTIESLHAVGSPVERGVGRLEPERDDDDEPDKPPTPGCHTPESCRENGCLGWCDEHKPEGTKP